MKKGDKTVTIEKKRTKRIKRWTGKKIKTDEEETRSSSGSDSSPSPYSAVTHSQI